MSQQTLHPGAAPPLDLAALADASALLRNMHHRLSLTQTASVPLPQFNPVPPAVDDRLSGAFTRGRKSVLTPPAPDRIRSELYPVAAPPIHQFLPGQNSRYIGRVPVVLQK